MSDKEKLARDITRYVDGLMSSGEERKFLQSIENDPELKAELAAQRNLKEVTDNMNMPPLPDEIWDGYWKGIYRQVERGTGWIFLSIGLIILLAVGVYHFAMDFLLNAEVPILVRAGIGFGVLGMIILLVSIGRERYFARTHERYEEIER